jgi:hypothetical protein
MLIEALKCLQPIPNFTHPNPIQNHPPINPQNTPYTNPTTKMISWNCGTLNTALPGLQSLTNKPIPPSIIAIQETKLTASKSTKYLHRLFPQYKMIFNNTTTITQTCRVQGQPYTNPKGGLLTLIHQHFAFPGNITKIPLTTNISPYLQIIKITNHPLSAYFLIHLYMPTQIEDILLIPIIQTTIFNHIHNNPQSNIFMLGDFNRDIALIGRQHGTTRIAPTQQDLEWKQFTNSLHLQYIPTDIDYSYQGGNNYTTTSLIDGFYTKIQQNPLNIPTFTSKTILNLKQNSDHFPICLDIPPNNIISKKHTPTPSNNKPKILNPIPHENINMFCIKFSETNTNQIRQLTNTLQNNTKLSQNQWQQVCDEMDQMVQNISKIIEDTCSVPPIPTLTSLTNKQGGYLPRKLQKLWKKELSTYHIIRKIIKLTTQDTNWRIHPLINNIQNHPHATIPNPPNDPILINEWIKTLGNIGKTAKKNARDIITKQTATNCKKAISKFRNTLNLQPKRIHKVIFKNTDNTTLDSIGDRQGIILTNPEDIAEEIYIQQSILNQPATPTCHHQPTHNQECVCGVRQYPWHDLSGFVLEKRGDINASISNTFDRITYDLCLKYLGNNKAPGPDNIPNSILKNIPDQFHDLLFLLFQQCYKQQQIPTSWKTSLAILLYKKSDPSILTNHRPIALANTIYKFFTSTITAQLANYGEKHQILQNSQEGFRQERCTSRQLQTLIAALEDSRLTQQDIYLLYIDFKNAFGSIDHARLLAIMADLGYPQDAINLIGNIYSSSSIIFSESHFGKTKPVHIQRGTIQGDTLSPYLFIISLEPLLRWLERGNLGYKLKKSQYTLHSAAYADDLAIITSNIKHIQPQINKIDKFCQWAGMELGISKCAITGCPNNKYMPATTFKAYIQSHNITYRNQSIPVLHQNEPYVYLGIQLIPSVKWKAQQAITMNKLIKQTQLLLQSPATLKQKLKMVDIVIRPGIAYSFYAVPYSMPNITKLDKKIIGLQKSICGLPKSTPNITTKLPHDQYGLDAQSLKTEYLTCISKQLRNALNDPGRLGTIYKGLTNHIFAKFGGAQHLLLLNREACLHSPTTRTLYLLKHNGLAHIQTENTTFPQMETPLTTIWLQKAINYPTITPNINRKYLHQLLLLNIILLEQITLPNRTTIMNEKEFKQYHNKITPTIKKALKIASHIFCTTNCVITCQPPCNIHQQAFTLLPEIINRPSQNFLHTPFP